MRQWGEFWGNRYKDYSHVNFALGSDRLVWPQVDSVVSGLKKYMPDRLVTTDWRVGHRITVATGRALTSSMISVIDGSISTPGMNIMLRNGLPGITTTWQNPVMPTCIFETLYEGLAAGSPKHIPTPPQMMRGQEWGTVLNGGSGFGILGSPDCVEDPIRWLGKIPGVEQAQYCTTFFEARRWYDLIPDWSHTFLTSQSGTPWEGRLHLRVRRADWRWLLGRMLLPRRKRQKVPPDRQHVEDGRWHRELVGTLVRSHQRDLHDHRWAGELGFSHLHDSRGE